MKTILFPLFILFLLASEVYGDGIDNNCNNEIDEGSIPSVTICDQVWMVKNLDVATYRNGDPIPKVTNGAAWAALTTGAYCYYNNDSATYAAIYGKLYNWHAVNDPRGLAPEGWHIPSHDEWTTLGSCLGGDVVAGGPLKETGTTHWFAPNTGATNLTGFTGLPGGFRLPFGPPFLDIGGGGSFWSSTASEPGLAWARILVYYGGGLATANVGKGNGYSVRCLKDDSSTCDDGIMNGAENGIDCGGPECTPCLPPDAVCGLITIYEPQCCPDINGTGANDIWLIPAASLDAGSISSSPAPSIQVLRFLSNLTFNWTTDGACVDQTPNGVVNNPDKGIVYRNCYPASPANFAVYKFYKLKIVDMFGSDECVGKVKLLNGSDGLSVPSVHFVIPDTDEYMSIRKTGAEEDEVYSRHTPAIDGLVVSPNPGDHLLQVQWNATKDGQVAIRIADMSGRIVITQEYEVLRGENIVSFDMTSQSSGLYAILVQSADEVMSAKWIKD